MTGGQPSGPARTPRRSSVKAVTPRHPSTSTAAVYGGGSTTSNVRASPAYSAVPTVIGATASPRTSMTAAGSSSPPSAMLPAIAVSAFSGGPASSSPPLATATFNNGRVSPLMGSMLRTSPHIGRGGSAVVIPTLHTASPGLGGISALASTQPLPTSSTSSPPQQFSGYGSARGGSGFGLSMGGGPRLRGHERTPPISEIDESVGPLPLPASLLQPLPSVRRSMSSTTTAPVQQQQLSTPSPPLTVVHLSALAPLPPPASQPTLGAGAGLTAVVTPRQSLTLIPPETGSLQNRRGSNKPALTVANSAPSVVAPGSNGVGLPLSGRGRPPPPPPSVASGGPPSSTPTPAAIALFSASSPPLPVAVEAAADPSLAPASMSVSTPLSATTPSSHSSQ